MRTFHEITQLLDELDGCITAIHIKRAHRGEKWLFNSEIRKITYYDSHQGYHLMKEPKTEEPRIFGPETGHTALNE